MPANGDRRWVRRGLDPRYAREEEEVYKDGCWLPARFFKQKKPPEPRGGNGGDLPWVSRERV